MDVFGQLSHNKGATSSALGKTLAQKILNGQTSILLDCIDLVSYNMMALDQNHIRAMASKVVEIVALNRPDLVAPYLHKLIPALSVREPQTRWMIIRVMGFCAHLNKTVAQDAIVYAETYIDHKDGLTLAYSSDLFLGDFGSISQADAQKVYPLLARSMENVIPGEQDWLLDALYKLFHNLSICEQESCFKFAERWQHSPRKRTQQKARRLLRCRA